MTPVLHQLEILGLLSIPIVASLDALTGSTLNCLDLNDRPITDLAPLGALPYLATVWLRWLPGLDLAPLASLSHLHDLKLVNMKEPIDLSPLAQTGHRLRVELWDTPTVGEPGPLVQVRRR